MKFSRPMSRIGKQPVQIPAGVDVTVERDGLVRVKGPKGELTMTSHPLATIVTEEVDGGNALVVTMKHTNSTVARALWGTTRALLKNMMIGVTEGFRKSLEINGVGYKVALNGTTLRLNVGYSHPVEYKLPGDVSATVEGNVITLTSTAKQRVGQVAAEIRKIRKPEPYKGKGIKYMDETIRRKAGKAAKAA